ncbi:hypothetical protein [uncultured Eubacterium sp.]|jgi:hypothetical protein|uniref:Uncharacterized protein n=1 Tax=Myoviridae sp. ctNQr16 TaxID=2826644 RepID=A0A8S5MBM2_9CAUD|nr:hypothetical protein [uncultured Eubacterium sp.]DAD79331.1 MAG TPA: hypothetical protein [Myoviridae sp. ctNQr16]
MGKSFKDMTTKELQEAGRKGGIKSGETKRNKKAMKETLELLLSMPLKNRKLIEPEQIKSFADLNGKNIDIQTAILIAQIQKALKGSVASAEFLRDTAGQRPEDIINLNTDAEDMNLNINISYGDEVNEYKG